MRAPRNAGLMNVLRLQREFLEGKMTGEQAFDALVWLELEPKERLVLHDITQHPDSTAAATVERLATLSHVHVATLLKRLSDLGILERNEFIGFQGRYFTYRRKGYRP